MYLYVPLYMCLPMFTALNCELLLIRRVIILWSCYGDILIINKDIMKRTCFIPFLYFINLKMWFSTQIDIDLYAEINLLYAINYQMQRYTYTYFTIWNIVLSVYNKDLNKASFHNTTTVRHTKYRHRCP